MEYGSTKYVISKKVFQNKKETKNNKKNLGNVQKHEPREKKLIASFSPPYQTYTWNVILKHINLKADHHTGGKCFIHDPKCHMKNQ